MNKSKRKPIIKDKPRNIKASSYYKKIRRTIKQKLKEAEIDEETELSNSKSIENDFNYWDYV